MEVEGVFVTVFFDVDVFGYWGWEAVAGVCVADHAAGVGEVVEGHFGWGGEVGGWVVMVFCCVGR